MSNYIEIIKQALIFFPLIALIISVPFILVQYHKFGSISFIKSFIIYSFVLYFICAYFLVILPLPGMSKVANLTSPRTQLIPFSFIIDFIKNTVFNISNFNTYLPALKQSCFFVPVYNIFLTLPFGIYLRYYFKFDLKKVLKYAFLLSLFFELTQLSGLYFIYPRGYRLFDIDDLILNTIGGLIGYLVCKPLLKILPKREKIDSDAREKGKIISGLRRTTVLFLDIFLYSFILFILTSFINIPGISLIVLFAYYILIPWILGGSTLGEKFLNIKIVDYNDKNNFIRLLFRKILFIFIYFGIPYIICFSILCLYALGVQEDIRKWLIIIDGGVIFLIYAITAIKYLFTNKKMIYERISKTKLISTIE